MYIPSEECTSTMGNIIANPVLGDPSITLAKFDLPIVLLFWGKASFNRERKKDRLQSLGEDVVLNDGS